MVVRRLAARCALLVIDPGGHTRLSRDVMALNAQAQAAKVRMSTTAWQHRQTIERSSGHPETAPLPFRKASLADAEHLLLAGAVLHFASGWFVRSLLQLLVGLALLFVAGLLFTAVAWALGLPQRSLFDFLGDAAADAGYVIGGVLTALGEFLLDVLYVVCHPGLWIA